MVFQESVTALKGALGCCVLQPFGQPHPNVKQPAGRVKTDAAFALLGFSPPVAPSVPTI